MATKLTNVSNPACEGYEWVDDETGRRRQVGQSRGTSSMFYGVQGVDGRWYQTPVVNPERFRSVLHAAQVISGAIDDE